MFVANVVRSSPDPTPPTIPGRNGLEFGLRGKNGVEEITLGDHEGVCCVTDCYYTGVYGGHCSLSGRDQYDGIGITSCIVSHSVDHDVRLRNTSTFRYTLVTISP